MAEYGLILIDSDRAKCLVKKQKRLNHKIYRIKITECRSLTRLYALMKINYLEFPKVLSSRSTSGKIISKFMF